MAILQGVITLLAVHYAYSLAFNPIVKEVMEFLQEKFLLDVQPLSRKKSVAYQNLFRSVTCFETKVQTEMDKRDSTSDDDDATQADFTFLDWMFQTKV